MTLHSESMLLADAVANDVMMAKIHTKDEKDVLYKDKDLKIYCVHEDSYHCDIAEAIASGESLAMEQKDNDNQRSMSEAETLETLCKEEVNYLCDLFNDGYGSDIDIDKENIEWVWFLK